MLSWSGSWADEADDDLGSPPPPSVVEVTSPQVSERRSYATATIEVPVIVEDVPRRRPVAVESTPPVQFSREAWGPVKTVRPPCKRVEFAVMTTSRDKPAPRRAEKVQPAAEIKCDNCHDQRGYLKFSETHVEAQPGSLLVKLAVGTYCLACTTAASPTCWNAGCSGKRVICLPGARYPFSPYCAECMTAHRASLKASQ